MPSAIPTGPPRIPLRCSFDRSRYAAVILCSARRVPYVSTRTVGQAEAMTPTSANRPSTASLLACGHVSGEDTDVTRDLEKSVARLFDADRTPPPDLETSLGLRTVGDDERLVACTSRPSTSSVGGCSRAGECGDRQPGLKSGRPRAVSIQSAEPMPHPAAHTLNAGIRRRRSSEQRTTSRW